MQISRLRSAVLGSFLLALLALPAAHAQEIYKWVDKDGKTHYSSRKEDAGDAKPSEVKVRQTAPSTPVAAPRFPGADAFGRQPQAAAQDVPPFQPPAKPVANAQPATYAGESNAAKCRLARDILSGAAQHNNGTQIDAYDRQVAENDVRTFCGK